MFWVLSNQTQAEFYYAYIRNQIEFIKGKIMVTLENCKETSNIPFS